MKTHRIIALALSSITALCMGQNPNTAERPITQPSPSSSRVDFTPLSPLDPNAPTASQEALVGVGVVLRMKDGEVVIEDIVPGSSAAAENNIHRGDRLVAVVIGQDQKTMPLKGSKLEEVVAMIRGKAGSVVRMIVTSTDESAAHEVRLVRTPLNLGGVTLPTKTPLHSIRASTAIAEAAIRSIRIEAMKQHLRDTHKQLLESTRAILLAEPQDKQHLAEREKILADYLGRLEISLAVLIDKDAAERGARYATTVALQNANAVPMSFTGLTRLPAYDDAELRSLSWQQFDETKGQYWHALLDAGRIAEAAHLIERYLALHPEFSLDAEATHATNLQFHAAQCHAFIGNKDAALKYITAARHRTPASDGLLWNDYLDGTVAFLNQDREALQAAFEKLATGPAINKDNAIVLARLLINFGKSYREAFNASDAAPAR